MTTGSGIFFSFMIVSIVILYGFTRDRWRWRRIVTIVLMVFFVIVSSVGMYVGIAYWWQLQPQVQDALWDLKIGMPVDEVLFKKGEPTTKEGEKAYIYTEKYSETYNILFNDGRIKAIFLYPKDNSFVDIQGIEKGETYEDIERKFGVPDSISISTDKLVRLISFDRYHVFFGLQKNRVEVFGIYDPALGPLKINK